MSYFTNRLEFFRKVIISNSRIGVFILAAICNGVLLNSCVEEISFENDNFESILVVDATITNEDKVQEILLSRTFEFGELDEKPEEGAEVKVIGAGVEYLFVQTEPGTYESVTPFSAQPNILYQLQIMTANGERFSSSEMQLTTVTQIDDIYAERVVNDDGVDGVAILVDSFDPNNTSNYYRYTFEETYKIIAPMWVDKDAFVIPDETEPPCAVSLRERPESTRVCYASQPSNTINITSTAGLSADRVLGHSVNFLSNQDYKISHRYSALVHQFVISQEVHEYLETIQSFNSKGSLFSQVQTGFVVGNIENDNNNDDKVIGIFEVSSVSSSRVYFNYRDFYNEGALPPFITECELSAPPQFKPGGCGGLLGIIESRSRVYYRDYDANPPLFYDPLLPGPYYMIPTPCGDCTVLGESEPPSFWVD